MKKIILIFVITFQICGCASMNTSRIMTIKGVPIYESRCDGTWFSFSSCLKYAYDTCEQSDFQIISKEDEISGLSQTSTAYLYNTNNPMLFSGIAANRKRSILFFCEKDLNMNQFKNNN